MPPAFPRPARSRQYSVGSRMIQTQRNPDPRIAPIVSRRRLAQFVRPKDLRAVLDRPIGQRAQCRSRKAMVLPHPQAAVKIADRNQRVHSIGSVDQHHQRASARSPPTTATAGSNRSAMSPQAPAPQPQKTKSPDQIEREHQRRNNPNQKRSQRSARSKQKIEQRRL